MKMCSIPDQIFLTSFFTALSFLIKLDSIAKTRSQHESLNCVPYQSQGLLSVIKVCKGFFFYRVKKAFVSPHFRLQLWKLKKTKLIYLKLLNKTLKNIHI